MQVNGELKVLDGAVLGVLALRLPPTYPFNSLSGEKRLSTDTRFEDVSINADDAAVVGNNGEESLKGENRLFMLSFRI